MAEWSVFRSIREVALSETTGRPRCFENPQNPFEGWSVLIHHLLGDISERQQVLFSGIVHCGVFRWNDGLHPQCDLGG